MKKKMVLVMTAAALTMGMVACGADNGTDSGANNSTISTEKNTENATENEMENQTESSVGNDAANSEQLDISSMTAVEILEHIWATYTEEEKPIVMGGDAEHMVDGAPGVYNIADVEGIDSMFHITSDAVAMTDEAASAIHAMNANTFTSSVFHLTDSSNAAAFAASVKESVLGTRWMCGFPEKLVVISVNDEFMISAFGNGDMIELFASKAADVYGDAAIVLVNEVIE